MHQIRITILLGPTKFYGVDASLIKSEKNIFNNHIKEYSLESPRTASDVVQSLYQHDMHTTLPAFNAIACILATIPATSCSAERSFSGLRRLKTYLRSTMGQTRLNDLAILHIERQYVNTCLVNVDQVIDIFGSRKGRDHHFF